MGREPYLARLAFGRSAFGAPIRSDDDGLFVPIHPTVDERHQQYDDNGRPRNPTSEAAARRFRKAQNEVLAACNIVITKHFKSTHENDRDFRLRRRKIETVDDENVTGLIMKGLDRGLGYALSWPAVCLQRHYLTFADRNHVLRPYDLIFGPHWYGLPAFAVSNLVRATWQANLDNEPLIRHANFLQLPTALPDWTRAERIQDAVFTLACLLIEIPIDICAVLQGLQLPVLPTLLHHVHSIKIGDLHIGHTLQALVSPSCLLLAPIYLAKQYLAYHIGWTVFGLFRQVFPHPDRPSELSVSRADHKDSMVDATSIPGLGRSLGPNTDTRFYGPRSFWSALKFLTRTWLRGANLEDEQQSIKAEVIRAGVRNGRRLFPGPGSWDIFVITRQQDIFEWLENDGIDVEEDFYVDLEQWCKEMHELSLRVSHPDEHSLGVDDHVDHIQDTAPQPGITRAISLTETSTFAPEALETRTLGRPGSRLRRPTETEAALQDQLAQVTNARNKRMALLAKNLARERCRYRVTRLSTFVSDSLAWHASSIFTSLLMLPMEALYCRAVTSWFISVVPAGLVDRIPPTVMFKEWFIESGKWRYIQTLLIALGLECACRGVLWQLESWYVVRYGRQCSGWGRF